MYMYVYYNVYKCTYIHTHTLRMSCTLMMMCNDACMLIWQFVCRWDAPSRGAKVIGYKARQKKKLIAELDKEYEEIVKVREQSQ